MDETLLERIFRALHHEGGEVRNFRGEGLVSVYRFRAIEERNGFSPPEPAGSLADRVIAALNLGRALPGHRFPPGVHRSRSIEAHARLRERWEMESVRSRATGRTEIR